MREKPRRPITYTLALPPTRQIGTVCLVYGIDFKMELGNRQVSCFAKKDYKLRNLYDAARSEQHQSRHSILVYILRYKTLKLI